MKCSPLHQRHLEARAKMADFGGWLMPIDYPDTGTLVEHTAVRESVGIFDVSHLGKASVVGAGASEFLNRSFTNDLNRIGDGQAQYTLMCDHSGGVIDDLIVYRHSAENFFLVPNASNTNAVVETLVNSAPAGIEIVNLHEKFGVIALQGPHTVKVLQKLQIDYSLDYMSFCNAHISGCEVILCRTGYTGEFGVEILPTWNEAEKVWDAIVEAMQEFGGRICGLGARDTLRTEMGYPLHGHELSLSITPVQASANWAVGWKKGDFAGSEVLRNERERGASRVLRGLVCTDRGIPRAGMHVKNSKGEVVGEVTSGTFSPTLKIGIALALITPSINLGDNVEIDVRGRNCSAKVTSTPFVPSHVK
ncbi:MAG: glycine cleavage system aminomethyltransferase GcvT [Actinobacteria bacterium]|nr:glycine cleavage system aminomethyltransferase GcvT [Actinomycetota bacterium]MSV86383.1 glycine cleavage system aminomethyltransferase GcvT [Actinomycetota bacterium]MSW67496.1 glycine cleavage system aminomethyltransferase GcvT [Actinomycetota bacterium]MSX28553.1 glycine cleavage system aminomethyltransferase GcvT [Actinomycetota bacterium]MSY03348.1 glycine cleavage system aminomethyltransferase GcvT [Actinomycetota bacterium]